MYVSCISIYFVRMFLALSKIYQVRGQSMVLDSTARRFKKMQVIM